jgi:hypothetical protein
VGEALVAIAAPHEAAEPQTVEALVRVFGWLGLAAEDAYDALHQRAMEVAAPTRARSADEEMDPDVMALLERETEGVDRVLAAVFADEEVPDPLPSPGSSESQRGLLRILAERPSWTRAEVCGLAAEIGLLPEVALDELNAVAWADWGGPVTWGDGPVEVDIERAQEMSHE